MRQIRQWLTAFSALALACGAGATGVRRHHSRPQLLDGLPQADYVRRVPPSPVALAISQTAVLIPKPDPSPNPDLDGVRVVYFQLAQGKLEVEHCSISRVALVLSSRGTWSLSLRADQNPVVPVGPAGKALMAQGAGANTKLTSFIRRNLFAVKIRGYGAFAVNAGALDGAPGRPLLLELCPAPFWVQNGEPEFKHFNGAHRLKGDIELVNRVEVEFSFR